GRAGWALPGETDRAEEAGTVLVADGQLLAHFEFEDRLREGAAQTLADLRRRGLSIMLLSGDRPETVGAIAHQLGIADWAAEVRPAGKLQRIDELRAEGRKILMIGD